MIRRDYQCIAMLANLLRRIDCQEISTFRSRDDASTWPPDNHVISLTLINRASVKTCRSGWSA